MGRRRERSCIGVSRPDCCALMTQLDRMTATNGQGPDS
jgi:hypothetical protein